MAGGKKSPKTGKVSTLSFEQQLWLAADKMRGHMDPAEYKHIALGLIFLKFISDAFEEQYQILKSQEDEGADPEHKDEYTAENVFWVPKEARWQSIVEKAKSPEIGKLLDDAMLAIERENVSLKGILPRDYNRPSLDKQRLGELIDLIGNMGLGDSVSRQKDLLGRVYEYFLGRFASAEGKGGGEFYTPPSVVQVLVEMLEPYKGRIYDPCCGSGGMFVQSEKFISAHEGKRGDISIYGQESNPTTWRLCKMNLAIRGIDGDIGQQNADSFHNNLHKDMKADFILANPPFNISDWGGQHLREDARWQHGIPPVGNANMAWVQHMVHHLSPRGFAGFVLANGSMSSNTSGEGEIRKNLIESNLVDCMVALPGQLFYTTQIPVCLWFLAKDRSNGLIKYPYNGGDAKLRDRRGEILFIDARKLGYLEDRVHRNLSKADIYKIADAYHAWRGEPLKDPFRKDDEGQPYQTEFADGYKDIPGFCKSATLEDVRQHGHVLTPGRYVGAAEEEEDGEPFTEKMQRLTTTLKNQLAESRHLDDEIAKQLAKVGYGD
ncbi:N-6 DNA methylase [Vampirovibrio sp.]|uniref:type I restriction-modification system subunit M n=1 Tax=Vampirovibrio sp. TaxID=2717857 RepID=UPI003593B57F